LMNFGARARLQLAFIDVDSRHAHTHNLLMAGYCRCRTRPLAVAPSFLDAFVTGHAGAGMKSAPPAADKAGICAT
jgi:hypothetical protein